MGPLRRVRWNAAGGCVERMDTLIQRLRNELPDELWDVLSRQHPDGLGLLGGCALPEHATATTTATDGQPATAVATGSEAERTSERTSERTRNHPSSFAPPQARQKRLKLKGNPAKVACQ